jgi:Ankyrin repeats (3 copies)
MRARFLPDRPNLSQYRKQAKELVKAVRTGDPVALARTRAHHPRAAAFMPPDTAAIAFALADAHLVIAREHGIESWPKFVKAIESRSGSGSPARVWTLAERAVVAGDVAVLERLLRDHGALLKEGPPRGSSFLGLTPDLSAGDARSIIAANHHFATWNDFEAFALELRDNTSATARFEAAVDAVVTGDEATLDRLLREHPELIDARSKRTHRSTLLLYVGANGTEGFRQRTPKNAVRIAQRLLDAGADVDAVGEMYRGTTTLGLVATSVHPVTSGVQAELIDMLVKAGASLAHAVAPDYTHGRVVNACLANGRGEGALLVADRGAELDLEGAAGVGRLDVVEHFIDEGGRLAPGVAREQLVRGCAWACQYGRRAVVEFLLGRGIHPAESRNNETMLHNAALGGHPDIVRLLIAHGAPIDVKDDHYHATPLGWALHGWGHRHEDAPAAPYYDIVRQLVAAGARVADAWLADEQVGADPQLLAALTGARPS